MVFLGCIHAVLLLIESESRLARERYEHAEWFSGNEIEVPLVQWKVKEYKMKIAECVLGMELVREFYTPLGVLMEYGDLIAVSERIFGVELSNYRSLKSEILKRKKNVTPFLSQMIAAIELAVERNNQK